MKGRSVQYHSNISKDEGRIFYETFTTLCEVIYIFTLSFLISRMWGINISSEILGEHVTGIDSFSLNLKIFAKKPRCTQAMHYSKHPRIRT